MRDEGIVDRVKNEIGPYFTERWSTLAEHPIVGEARNVGLMAALEIVKHKSSGERFSKDANAGGTCRDFCIKNGLVMRACGQTMIVAPPLVLTKEHVDELVEKAWKSLDMTAATIGRD